MNGILNGIVNWGGCFHNLHKLAKMAIFTKKNPGAQKKTHLEGVDPAPQVLNKNGPWVLKQEQNAFILHKTIYDEQNYPSYKYQGLWGPMGTYGDLWGPMGTFGGL